MKHWFKSLGLLLLLLSAQQGAVVHELSHVFRSNTAQRVASGVGETTCTLCPAFAQVVTPTFSHAFQIPLLVRVTVERSAEPAHVAFDRVALDPRSRGPPA